MKIIRRLNRNQMLYNKLKLGLYNLNVNKSSQQHYQNSNKNKIEDIFFSQQGYAHDWLVQIVRYMFTIITGTWNVKQTAVHS